MQKPFMVACLAAVTLANVPENADGTAGNAPCLESYVSVCGECSSQIGEDPHTVHGLQAKDGSLVAVGQTLERRY